MKLRPGIRSFFQSLYDRKISFHKFIINFCKGFVKIIERFKYESCNYYYRKVL